MLEQFVANRYVRIKQMADLSIVKYGRIDAIFNNAGIMPAVDTELYTSIHHEENRKWVQQNSANPELSMKSEDIADAVAYVVGTPNSVSISEMVIRPTKQPI
ncbi:hypothetical protein ACFW1P_05650 [Paenibacillus sp. NPDC058910]|uniref:hypothetical protein n=1 Tax=unclassified Paenibacillus TaxID=185978 RepID=UPI0036BD1F45